MDHNQIQGLQVVNLNLRNCVDYLISTALIIIAMHW